MEKDSNSYYSLLTNGLILKTKTQLKQLAVYFYCCSNCFKCVVFLRKTTTIYHTYKRNFFLNHLFGFWELKNGYLH